MLRSPKIRHRIYELEYLGYNMNTFNKLKLNLYLPGVIKYIPKNLLILKRISQTELFC